MIQCRHCKRPLEVPEITAAEFARARELANAKREPELRCPQCKDIVKDAKAHFDALYEERHRKLIEDIGDELDAWVNEQIPPQRRGSGRPRKAQAA